MKMNTVLHRSFLAVGVLALLVIGPLVALAQTQNPNLRIISPAGSTPAKGTVTIIGSANPPGFARYELAYGTEPEPPTWTVVGASNQAVDGNSLGTWNTRPLPDGGYALRLQVFGENNVLLGESFVRNITLTNQLANPANTNTAVTTDTAPTSSAVVRNTGLGGFSISDIPRGFALGIRYTAYAFGAFLAYLLLKQLVKLVWNRRRHKRVDYGR
jgi:hypothetical protein